jgi:hypothetical protein
VIRGDRFYSRDWGPPSPAPGEHAELPVRSAALGPEGHVPAYRSHVEGPPEDLEATLQTFLGRPRGPQSQRGDDLTPSQRRRLRALGYVEE